MKVSKLTRKLTADERVLWWGRPLKTPFLMGALELVSVGVVTVTLITYLAVMYWQPNDLGIDFSFFFFGGICAGLFLVYAPYRLLKGSRDSEYMVTSQRVFFETLSESPFEGLTSMISGWKTTTVVDLKDIQEVYIKRGVHDRIFGTSTLYVLFRGFQRTTTSWAGNGRVTVVHNPPSFPFIMGALEVQRIILEAVEKARAPNSQAGVTLIGFDQHQTSVQVSLTNPSKERFNKKQKIPLVLGVSLLLIGVLVFSYGYFTHYSPYVSYENGYTYIDYVAIVGSAFGGTGALLLFFVFYRRFDKWARGHGAIVS